MYNEYEASEVMEVGKAEEMILGIKWHHLMDEPGLTPLTLHPLRFANFDE